MPYSSVQSNGHCVPPFCQYLVQAPSRSGGGTTVASKQYFLGSTLSHNHCSIKSNATSYSITLAVLNGWEKEEARWLREEKRWLREEERWLREEVRWVNERKALLEQGAAFQAEIKTLKEEIVRLEKQVVDGRPKDDVVSNLVVSVAKLLQSMKNASSESFTSMATPMSIPISASASANVARTFVDTSSLVSAAKVGNEVPVNLFSERVSILEAQVPIQEVKEQATKASNTNTKRSVKQERTLRRGAEGDDVKELQEALAKLGFYSGEEDMEESVFSSGTERAVRTWQASVGTSEDGIISSELLIKLLGEDTLSVSQQERSSKQKPQTAAPAASAKGSTTPLLKPPASKATSSPYDEASHRRVYLLGENRWEEPERLLSKNGPSPGVGRCVSCRGQGNMVCTECEGTGELNVEEQFLEWAEEGASCPYCGGKGIVDCDVCNGKG